MRIFAPKQNQPQKPGPLSSLRPKAAVAGGPKHHHKAGLNAKVSPLFGPDFSRIPIDPPASTTLRKGGTPKSGLEEVGEPNGKEARTKATNALVQRKAGDLNGPADRRSRQEENQKAELEFHSTIAFNGTNSGTSSTGPSQEGFTVLQIKWVVWNTGWETAPAHMDRMTIYHADRCSGCRDEKDEMLKAEVEAPVTSPTGKPGDGEFRYESTSPMVGMTIQPGHYEVYIDLDVYDEVEEINEDNNTIFTSFFVRPRDKSDPDTDAGEESTDSQ